MEIKKENASHVDAISSSIRTQGPGNLLFRIESFSLLLEVLTKTKSDKCDSCHFKAGGYKWKLSVYPNGDSKRGGDGCISLYLALADPKSLPRDEEIHLFFKFFVFDYRLDSYLVLEDGKDRRFHGLNTEWGFAKLLPLEIFKDPSRGYLVDDRCAFGVEMFIHEKKGKRGMSTFTKNNVGAHESSFTWKIDKFSKLPELHKSAVFSIGGHKWILHLYPRGDSRAKDQCLSLFLVIDDHSSLPRGWDIHAEFKLRILDQLGQKHHERAVGHFWLNNGTSLPGKGFPEFMSLSDLKDESRGFIVKDTVVIEVIFTGICSVNSLP